MSVENLAMWSERYRASVTDPATPELDQAILAAAAQHSVSRRAGRRARQAALATAFAVAALTLTWFTRPPIPDASVSATDFGLLEGASRPFLLDAGRTVYIAPGLREGLP
jgi:ferric-dicitrate binding protein FerR (iron transport regulator)